MKRKPEQRRKVQKPKLKDDGYSTHPSWGLIGASRVSSSPGQPLFDSDIAHSHYIMVRISRAERKRSLMHDHNYPSKEIIEIRMSEAQWASFVSSMNAGSGVPCTIDHIERKQAPEAPYEPRLAETMEEVRKAADEAMEKIQKALFNYKNHKTVGNLRDLEAAINNSPRNIEWAGEVLAEHAENVVQKSRADIEAMVVAKAEQLQIDPSEITSLPLLEE